MKPKTHEKALTDIRANLTEAVNLTIYKEEPTLITRRNKPVAVIVSVEFYERALKLMEGDK